MNAEELKRLEEIKSDYGFLNEEGVSEYPNEEVGWLISRLEAAEATCQSLLDQSSRWEAQALEAEARLVECEGVSLLREKGGKVWERQAHAAEARCAELEALFALQRTRMAEAIRAWQEATGKQDVLPDLGDLLAWLMARAARADKALAGEPGDSAGRSYSASSEDRGSIALAPKRPEIYNAAEVVQRERAAFVAGCREGYPYADYPEKMRHFAEQEALRRYPEKPQEGKE